MSGRSKEVTKNQKVNKGKKAQESVEDKKVESVAVEQTESTDKKQKGSEEMKFTTQLEEVKSQMKLARDQLQTLLSSVKKLETAYQYDVKKTSQRKQKRQGEYKPTGFAKASDIPEPLTAFIGVPAGTQLTGPELTSKVWDQLESRGLKYSEDKRVFRTNAEVTKVFGVPASVNKSVKHNDPEGFNFCNLQKYIARALGKEPAPSKSASVPAPTTTEEVVVEKTVATTSSKKGGKSSAK